MNNANWNGKSTKSSNVRESQSCNQKSMSSYSPRGLTSVNYDKL